jgi:hypothetical protein
MTRYSEYRETPPVGTGRPPKPVTLPPIELDDIDVEIELKEAAARVAERKVVRQGLDAWRAIGKAESFDGWKTIGAALAIGKAHALRVTGANTAWGRNYSREFSQWLKRHGFDAMAKSARSVAIELHENAKAIEAWRATLPERQRRRLVHPLSNVRRWRAATGQYQAQRFRDLRWEAEHHWRRFVACVSALPADQAILLWQAVLDVVSRQAIRAGQISTGCLSTDRSARGEAL